MASINDILSAAKSLPSSERARLITPLWNDLSPEDWAAPSPEWIEESNRRSDAIDSSEMDGSSWEDVRQSARRKASLDD